MASIWASIKLGTLQVDIEADGHHYAPDLVHDILHQAHATFADALATAHTLGLVIAADDIDDTDD